MTITLYGAPVSPPYNLIALVLRELGLSYEEKEINISAGEHKNPPWDKLVPFSEVPWIDDDGTVLYESRAVCRYLVLKYGPKEGSLSLIPSFTPSTPEEWKAYISFEQAVNTEQHGFNRTCLTIFPEMVYKPLIWKQQQDAPTLARMKAKLDQILDAYDVILSTQKYLAGDQITLADLFHIPYGDQVDKLPHENGPFLTNPKRPNVVRWWKDITSRRSWADLKILNVQETLQKRVQQ